MSTPAAQPYGLPSLSIFCMPITGLPHSLACAGVKIKKCRYLESSGCVGMCTNMCKLPTQKFFTETFGQV
jgi:hypothetical protein